MRNTFFALSTAVALFSGVAHAADPSSSADLRGTLYKQEVRAALTKHLWSITQDETGKLTAERRIIQSGPTGITGSDNSFARLMIDFHADNRHHTDAAARASVVVYEQRSSPYVGRTLYPPLALRDPQLTREYREILAEADAQLALQHPAFAAITAPGSKPADRLARVAMK